MLLVLRANDRARLEGPNANTLLEPAERSLARFNERDP
jgi:hypothetical protein